MTHKHTYDNQGLATSYLLLSILVPILVYLIFKRRQRQPTKCKCSLHRKKAKRVSVPYAIIAIIAVILVLFYNISTIKLAKPADLADPYVILGLEDSASKKEIRKAYRKLLRENDPDKFPDNKAEMSKKMAEINNAYSYLSNPKKEKQNYNKIESEIVAIPQTVVDNGRFVFFVYIGLVAILFPWFGISKWRKSIKCNSLGVNYKSVETYYKKINTLLARDINCTIRNFFHLLCESEEMKQSTGELTPWAKKEICTFEKEEANSKNNTEKSDKYRATKMFVKKYIENNYAYPVNDGKPIGYYVLLDHLFRSKVFTSQSRCKVANFVLDAIEVLKRVALAKNLRELVDVLYVFERMVFQCVCDPNYGLLQYPNVTFEDVFTKKNVSIEEIDIPRLRIKGISAYVAKIKDQNVDDIDLTEGTDVIEEVEGSTVEKEYHDSGDVIDKKHFKLEKETLVTVKVTLDKLDSGNARTGDFAFMLKIKGQNDVDMINAMGHTVRTPVHTPHSDLKKYVQWECLYVLNGTLLKKQIILADFIGQKDVFVEIESTKGSSKLEVIIKNGQYFGLDVSDDIIIDYV